MFARRKAATFLQPDSWWCICNMLIYSNLCLKCFACVYMCTAEVVYACKWCLFESTDSLKLHSPRWHICPSSYGNKIQTLSASRQIKKQEERREKEQNHFGENWSQLSIWYQTRSHNTVRETLLCQWFFWYWERLACLNLLTDSLEIYYPETIADPPQSLLHLLSNSKLSCSANLSLLMNC